VSRASTSATRWFVVAPAFALSVLFNAGLFSFLGYAVFAILFVEVGEAREGLGLMWVGSLVYISILSVASIVALPAMRESSTTAEAVGRYGATVLLVAASGTGFTWLAGPIFPWG